MLHAVEKARAADSKRNTYKVLLTRGMIGTAVYSVDARTQDFLATLLDR
ncbi:DNA/RNA helicase domain-containing protein [Microbispora catharanthi]|uniref:DUF2075 domain-containing protein n=1 Tax=Microbispora catharanthi TaxID=1712871 RepID=A0A5N6BHE9_9ACTN|nr:DNA/RNA helicase domain-containing protein [Microbispora catharanthi]KAB8180467.1 DUF2075 domain-containing protein [Microbispora catharanthi]